VTLDGVSAGSAAHVRAVGVDAATGALVVEDPGSASGERLVHAGEVVRLRLVPGQV
jgi:hypothetical protein